MSDIADTLFSHVKPAQTGYVSGGLRDFFLYRDLGIAAATQGKVIAHLVKANMAPEKGTGWHRHEAEFQIVIMLKGWARFMYDDQETLVEAGDCVHQRPGIKHFLFDYSPDMEYLDNSELAGMDVQPDAFDLWTRSETCGDGPSGDEDFHCIRVVETTCRQYDGKTGDVDTRRSELSCRSVRDGARRG